MKALATLIAVLLFAGCTTNGVYDGKKTLLLVGSVVVAGYATSHGSDKKETCGWVPNSSVGNELMYICK